MRLWSIHPSYLDARGLTACWREGLLARKVLLGETEGYQHHPQLERFRAQAEPVAVLDRYLLAIWEEAARRGFAFNREKIGPHFSEKHLTVTTGQLAYEWQHLKEKLKVRSRERYERLATITTPAPHPSFTVIEGVVADWEKTRSETRMQDSLEGI